MNRIENRIVRNLLAKRSIAWAGEHPSYLNIAMMLSLNHIQLTARQLKAISRTIKEKAPCKLLVFGLGYDSLFWVSLNRGGKTVFLEDQEDWLQKIAGTSNQIEAFFIHYASRRTEWKMFLESPASLDMPLPDPVSKERWDVILVDGPAGHKDHTPGRMKSIYLASQLIKDCGDVFVHDTNREIEDLYCNTFFRNEDLIGEIRESVGHLRHYHIVHRSV